MDLSLDLCASETCHSVPASVELEGMWVGDRWKQDECRRGLTFDDDAYQSLDPLIHGLSLSSLSDGFVPDKGE